MPGPLERTPDMEGMSPAERAAEYKRRSAAAGIGRAPNPGAAPAAAPAAPAKPAPPPEPEKPKDPVFVTRLIEAIPEATWQWRHGYAEMKVPRESLLRAARLLRDEGL